MMTSLGNLRHPDFSLDAPIMASHSVVVDYKLCKPLLTFEIH